jgi:thiol-disulfide isomerase/thioredoxin
MMPTRTSLTRSMPALAVAFAFAFVAAACTPTAAEPSRPPPTGRIGPADPALDDQLVGTTLPGWTADEWLNSPPLTLAGLRGRVVLVRWFMGSSCPYCSATAPALNALYRDYGSKGLTVVGMYHHKEPVPLEPGEYAGFVKAYGFAFPVGLDTGWKTLKAWWLDGTERDFTSVSFLIDRQSRVRGIHKGGRYAPGDADYDTIKRGIELLLAER